MDPIGYHSTARVGTPRTCEAVTPGDYACRTMQLRAAADGMLIWQPADVLAVDRRVPTEQPDRTSEDHRHMSAWSTVFGLVRAVRSVPQPEFL